MTEWQPLDTAPKDGTRILVWYEEFGPRVEIGRYNPDLKRWYVDSQDDNVHEYPTHWMPLPPKPVSLPSPDPEQQVELQHSRT